MTTEVKAADHSISLAAHQGRRRHSQAMMTRVEVVAEEGQPPGLVRMGETLSVAVSFSCPMNPISPVLGVVVKSAHGAAIFGINNKFVGGFHVAERVVSGTITAFIENLPLMPGTYLLDLWLNDGVQDLDVISDAIPSR